MARSPSPHLPPLGVVDLGENVYAVLGRRAREHSLAHLLAEAAVSAALSILLAVQRHTWWALYLPLGVLACYSVWGLADRAAHAMSDDRRAGRLARRVFVGTDWILVAFGTLGVLLLFMRVTGYLLGNWVH